ncbi:MAG: YncE family protein [Acidobacteria bacterium]|nr:YncE family protein [Acidobacteriota bacterium]
MTKQRYRPRVLEPGVIIAALATLALIVTTAVAVVTPRQASAQNGTYWLYVAAESDDVVEKLAFTPGGGFRLDKSIPVGIWPTETEGPHGLAISPDGEHWYVTIAHGNPFGLLFKYETADDLYVADTTLGLFPATMTISPSTGLLFAANFNLHGDHVPSTISVVETESMTEVAQIPTGVMPHGSRMNPQGSRQYSVAMMNDELREIDAYKLTTSRVLPLSENAPSWQHYQETGNGLMDDSHAMGDHQMAGMEGHHEMQPPLVKPTWATPVTPQGKVYVAGNGNATIYEIDVEEWAVSRTFDDTGKGVYNLDVTPDGKILVGTYKSDRGVGIWSTETGEELARIPTIRPIPHGVVISPDGKFAFVSIEGIGGEPGSVEAYSLESFERVANIDIAKQAGGIVFWKAE